MLVNAFYDKGKIILPDEIKIKEERVPVVVEIPDEEIVKEETVSKGYKIKSLRLREKMSRLDSIRHYNSPYFPEERSDKEQLLEGIQMKYGYIEDDK